VSAGAGNLQKMSDASSLWGGCMLAMKTYISLGLASAAAMVMLASETEGRRAATAQGQTTIAAYEGARLIDGTGGAVVENAVLVVRDGRFTAVGRAGQVNVPAGATRVSLTGKTVMPAIFDTHTHMAATREELVEQLRRKAFYGVAAVMSLGQDAGELPFQIRQEIIPGAALFRTAGRGITLPEPGRSEAPYWITTLAEGRKAVQELASKKVDIVKIWVDDRDGKYKKLTPDLYGPIIEDAHKHGLRVTAHVFTLEDAKGLVRAGVDAFAHGVRDKDVDDEFVQMMKQRPAIVLVPNLPDRGVVTDFSWLAGSIAGEELKKLQDGARDNPAAQRSFGIQARNLARLNAAGVQIALGTDGAIPWSHHFEMADMAAAGMTPREVIVASTRNAARFMRVENAGTVEPGRSADFLVLDANPLDDITNTRKISAVYLRGNPVDRAAMRSK
jgi:imidazolonepropionase-like amidohydrolase